ncbi:MAG: carbonic anhydrase [Pseudomonadota bacterium]
MTTSAKPTLPLRLTEGYAAFKKGDYLRERERYEELASEGQTPECLVVACCDSRAAPETIFNTRPGEIFVVRNVANIVPPYEPDGQYHATSAALEFAVQALKVTTILVMGHGRCGGIAAALDQDMTPLSSGDFIGRWMDLLKEPAEIVAEDPSMTKEERQTALERMAIRNSIENLRTFPYIKAREDAGEISLNGAWFDISSGELWALEPESGEFALVDS